MATRFEPSGPLRGTLRPPPDKSISHRAALIAAMGEGETTIENFLDSADTRSTLAAVEALGAGVAGRTDDRIESKLKIRGVGMRGATERKIDVGNAGTLMRLLPGWLAGQEAGRWELDGDASIRTRPVGRIVAPLKQMGARIGCREDRWPPLWVEAAPLHGSSYTLPIASAQVKSCLLLAGLMAEGQTRIVEPQPTRDHSERMLTAAGAEIDREGNEISVRPAALLEPGEIAVPGDFSSAAFFVVAALVVPGSDVSLVGVGLNPTRTRLLEILKRMGADIEQEQEAERGNEPSGRIRIRHSQLRGTEVGGDDVPLAIDELPLVVLAACFADGETTIREAGELRQKESDRIKTTSEALTALGAEMELGDDWMRIGGGGGLRGGSTSSHHDHRIAMLGAIAGLASEKGAEVEGMNAAAISYPRFEADLGSLRGG